MFACLFWHTDWFDSYQLPFLSLFPQKVVSRRASGASDLVASGKLIRRGTDMLVAAGAVNFDSRSDNNSKDGNPSSVVVATIIVNGALDKVRDGYYPPIFFPALAKTMPFYRNCCEPILFVKPISDKGYYGWMFRVYPEPWQIILQLPKRVVASSSSTTNDDETVVVEDIVVLVSETRPSYQEAVTAMVQEAQKRSLLSSSL